MTNERNVFHRRFAFPLERCRQHGTKPMNNRKLSNMRMNTVIFPIVVIPHRHHQLHLEQFKLIIRNQYRTSNLFIRIRQQ